MSFASYVHAWESGSLQKNPSRFQKEVNDYLDNVEKTIANNRKNCDARIDDYRKEVQKFKESLVGDMNSEHKEEMTRAFLECKKLEIKYRNLKDSYHALSVRSKGMLSDKDGKITSLIERVDSLENDLRVVVEQYSAELITVNKKYDELQDVHRECVNRNVTSSAKVDSVEKKMKRLGEMYEGCMKENKKLIEEQNLGGSTARNKEEELRLNNIIGEMQGELETAEYYFYQCEDEKKLVKMEISRLNNELELKNRILDEDAQHVYDLCEKQKMGIRQRLEKKERKIEKLKKKLEENNVDDLIRERQETEKNCIQIITRLQSQIRNMKVKKTNLAGDVRDMISGYESYVDLLKTQQEENELKAQQDENKPNPQQEENKSDRKVKRDDKNLQNVRGSRKNEAVKNKGIEG